MKARLGRLSITLAITGLLIACKTGYNREVVISGDAVGTDCEQDISNNNSNATTKTVFDALADFSCNGATQDGVIVGQSTGSGDQIVGTDARVSYASLIEALKPAQTTDSDGEPTNKGVGDFPTIVAIDYERDKLYTTDQIQKAHDKLKEHWDAGGLVSISWTPLNPWENDGADPANSPGSATDTAFTDDVDLAALIFNINSNVPTGTISDTWRNRLDVMADRLRSLQDQGITVLWTPLPEPNNDQYWWGVSASYKPDAVNDATAYTNLWINMYDYFTITKQLTNLLWVYAPAESDMAEMPDSVLVPDEFDGFAVDWAFPYGPDEASDTYVDVVGAVVMNDDLRINEYDDLVDIGRPLGLTRFSTMDSNSAGTRFGGTLDNTLYADRFAGSYPAIAFWIAWHDYRILATENKFSIINNLHEDQLFKRTSMITANKFVNRNLRDSTSN